MKNLNDKYRYPIVDFIKGFTVILMIFFHFCFDLNYFKLINVDIINGPFWWFLPRLIVFLFFFAVGMSLKIAHSKNIHWKSFLKREFRLILLAALISIATKLFFPDNWIYFGTLHSIAIVSLFALPFLKYEKVALTLGILLFFFSIVFNKNVPWFELPIASFDYISPFPWIGAVFFGIYATKQNLHKMFSSTKITNSKSLNLLGSHSLAIYIVHQPILFSFIAIFAKIKS